MKYCFQFQLEPLQFGVAIDVDDGNIAGHHFPARDLRRSKVGLHPAAVPGGRGARDGRGAVGTDRQCLPRHRSSLGDTSSYLGGRRGGGGRDDCSAAPASPWPAIPGPPHFKPWFHELDGILRRGGDICQALQCGSATSAHRSASAPPPSGSPRSTVGCLPTVPFSAQLKLSVRCDLFINRAVIGREVD